MTLPSVVMRPMWSPAASLNHSTRSRTTMESRLRSWRDAVLELGDVAAGRDAADPAHLGLGKPEDCRRGRASWHPGPAFGVGSGNSVISPCSVMRPILLPVFSANQRSLYGPWMMPIGVAFGVGGVNSLNDEIAWD